MNESALILASIYSALYYIIWRVNLNFTLEKKSKRIIIGATFVIVFIILFMLFLPKVYFHFYDYNSTPIRLLILSPYIYYIFGFFLGLFCLIPIAGWTDPVTYNNPVFQRKNDAHLFIFILIYIYGIGYSIFSFDLNFDREGIVLRNSIFYKKEIPYKNITSFNIHSELKHNSKGYSYHEMIYSIYLKDKSIKEIYTTKSLNSKLALRTNNILNILKVNNVPIKVKKSKHFEKWFKLLIY